MHLHNTCKYYTNVCKYYANALIGALDVTMALPGLCACAQQANRRLLKEGVNCELDL